MKYYSLAFTYKFHESNAFKKNGIVLLRWKIQIPQEMMPGFPVFLVPHQTAVALAEEWMLVGVLLCSMPLLSLPLPSAVGIFTVLFSTSFKSDSVTSCHYSVLPLSALMCLAPISSFLWCKSSPVQQQSPLGFPASTSVMWLTASQQWPFFVWL